MAPPSFARIAIARIARSLANATNVSSLSLIPRDLDPSRTTRVDVSRRRSAFVRARHYEASRATMRRRAARLFDETTGDETTRRVASTARGVREAVGVVVGRRGRLARVTSG